VKVTLAPPHLPFVLRSNLIADGHEPHFAAFVAVVIGIRDCHDISIWDRRPAELPEVWAR